MPAKSSATGIVEGFMSMKFKNLDSIFTILKLTPVKEYRFHDKRRWRVDYAFPDLKIAIEYEGLSFRVDKSRHTTLTGFSNDAEKYNELAIMGWKVLRFTAIHLNNGIAIEQIQRLLKEAI